MEQRSQQLYTWPRFEHRAKDVETWLSNSLAMILAGVAIAAGVIGLFVAFGYIDTSTNTPFENGMTWMAAGLILALCANVFRREHHVVDTVVDPTLPREMPITTPARQH